MTKEDISFDPLKNRLSRSILMEIIKGNNVTCNIAAKLNLRDSNVSEEIRKIKNIGLITYYREGKYTKYFSNAVVLNRRIKEYNKNINDKISKLEKLKIKVLHETS